MNTYNQTLKKNLSVNYVLEETSLHGGVKVVFEHASILRSHGIESSVVSKGEKPDWMDTDVPVITVPDFSSGNLPYADVYVATYWTTVLPVIRSGRAGKVFHFCQGYEGSISYFKNILPEIEKAYAQPVPKILIAPYLKPLLSKKFPGPYHVVPQAIDHTLYYPTKKDRPSEPFKIAIVGPFIIDLKGIPEALGALSLLRQKGMVFSVLRASAMSMDKVEKDLGMTDEFYESLSAREMGTFYRKADLLVHPSHSAEGFPLPPLEAMACGVPVAHSDIPSFDAIPAEAAIRFKAGDTEAIASAVLRVISDKGKWQELREKGLKAASEFNFDRAGLSLIKILTE